MRFCNCNLQLILVGDFFTLMGKEMSSLLIVSFLRNALSIIQLRIEDNHILGVVGVLFETLKNIFQVK